MFEDLKKGLYQTFILDDNYQYFIKGIQTTLIVTVFALILGVILGVIIAIIRSAHDQQPDGRQDPHGGADQQLAAQISRDFTAHFAQSGQQLFALLQRD